MVDGAYAETGEKIVEHIRTHYGRGFHINHMVPSHADNDHASGLVEVMKKMEVRKPLDEPAVEIRGTDHRALPPGLHPQRA